MTHNFLAKDSPRGAASLPSEELPEHQGSAMRSTHRRTVIRIYLGLRLVFVLTTLALLLLHGAGHLHLPLPIIRDNGLSLSICLSLAIFGGWSILLAALALYALPKGKLEIMDAFILISLIPDAIAIYLASAATGGPRSPFYHLIYLLIATYSYYLVGPGKNYELRLGSRLATRHFLIGTLPPVLAAFFVYWSLCGLSRVSLGHFVELGLQLALAISFTSVGFQDSRRSLVLLRKEQELEQSRATLDTARQYQDLLLQALGRVTFIAEMSDEGSLSSALNELAEKIGQTFQAQYCAIGLAGDTTVENVAVWTSFALSEHARRLLESARVSPIHGSLIGKVLLNRRAPLAWDKLLDGDNRTLDNPTPAGKDLALNPEAASRYREIFPDSQVHHLLLVPFYAPKELQRPAGYLHLMNRQDADSHIAKTGFTQAHSGSLEAIAGQLAIAIENFRNHRRDREELEDETFAANLASRSDAADLFGDLLSFYNQKLDSRVASLWLPIEDGFGPPEESRKLALRAVSVSGPETHESQNRSLENRLRQIPILHYGTSYVGRYLTSLERFGEIHYQDNLVNHPHWWTHLSTEIGCPRLVVVPIEDPLADPRKLTPPAERVLAVLCFRPRAKDFQLTLDISERLRRFARQIEGLILENRLRRRFEQIQVLKEGLEKPQADNLQEFYHYLVSLIREIMGAEACTLFLRGRSPTELQLKASTAEFALAETSGGKAERVQISQYLERTIYSTLDTSITVHAFRSKTPVLVYDSRSSVLSSSKFLEVVPTINPRSVMAAPILSGHEVIGVLRCINQQKPYRLPLGFLRPDLEFFSLLAGVAARFIENAVSTEVRRQFLRELTHELATPLLIAQTNTSFLERYFKEEPRNREPLRIVASLRETLLQLQAQVSDIQYQLVRPGFQESSLYRFTGPVDVHGLIEQVRKSALPIARESRAIEIFGHTATLPSLHVDKVRMEQVLYNLLQNAIKYSRFGGLPIRIRHTAIQENIAGTMENRWHKIEVESTGIGVPPGEEEVIFEEYRRGSNTQFVSTGQSGTGMGLPISRKIVERHGGLLRLDRRDNPTIFSIFLPQSLETGSPFK